MADVFGILSRMSPVKRPDDDALWQRTKAIINRDQRNPEAPFETVRDVWFLAIGWALQKGLTPSDETGVEFNKIGRTGRALTLDPWQCTLLTALYLKDHEEFMESESLSAVSISPGRITQDGSATGASPIVTHANRYALAGWGPLIDALMPQRRSPGLARQLIAAKTIADEAQQAADDFNEAFNEG